MNNNAIVIEQCMNVSGVYLKLLCFISVALVEPNRIAKVIGFVELSPCLPLFSVGSRVTIFTRIVLIKLDIQTDTLIMYMYVSDLVVTYKSGIGGHILA